MNNKNYVGMIFPCLLIFYELIINLSNDMYTPAMPALVHDFSSTQAYIQLTVTVWFAGSILVHPVIGFLSDYYGRRRILMSGGILFLISTLYCIITHNIILLLIARFFQGLTAATLIVAGYASVHELYDDKKAMSILVWMNSATIIAPIIGPFFGGLLLTFTSWHNIFLLIAVLAGIILLGLYKYMPEKIEKRVTISSVNIREILLSYRKILSNPIFLFGSIIAGLIYGSIVIWIVMSPFLIMTTFNKSPLFFGLIQIPIFTSYIIGAQFMKALLKRNMSNDFIILLGLSISLITSVFLLQYCFTTMINLQIIIILMSCLCFGSGMIMAPINRLCVTASQEGMGMITAMFDMVLVSIGTLCAFVVNIIQGSHLFSLSLLLVCIITIAWLVNLAWSYQKRGHVKSLLSQ